MNLLSWNNRIRAKDDIICYKALCHKTMESAFTGSIYKTGEKKQVPEGKFLFSSMLYPITKPVGFHSFKDKESAVDFVIGYSSYPSLSVFECVIPNGSLFKEIDFRVYLYIPQYTFKVITTDYKAYCSTQIMPLRLVFKKNVLHER